MSNLTAFFINIFYSMAIAVTTPLSSASPAQPIGHASERHPDQPPKLL
ncbi:hypothetical protein [Xylophilus sp.]|nr:hypothetical protein [Xylophilus sp.]